MGRLCWLAPLCAALWLAACGSDREPPPAAAAGGGSNPSISPLAGSGFVAGERNAPGAGGAPGAGVAGETGEPLPIGQIGGNFTEPIAGAPSIPSPLCNSEVGWGNATALAGISTDADERLLTLTADERTLVFERAGALFVADRARADAGFTSSTPLTLPTGYGAGRGLALDGSGLQLVVARDDGAGFAELKRSSRSVAFGDAADAARFAAVNDARMFSGGELSSPVLSEDGKTFFYVEHSSARSDVWRATGSRLDERTKLDPVTLGGEAGRAKLTLSVSTDLRSLFVFDEALGHVVGLWSEAPEGAFTRAVLFRDLETAFANSDCSRLYGTRTNGASLDIVIEAP